MKYNYCFFLLFLSIFSISPLLAAEKGEKEVMSRGATTLYYYAENNRWDDFEIHLRNIFLPKAHNGQDYADENGLTLLHLAVRANQERSVKLLLEMGATIKTSRFFEKNGQLIEVARPLKDAQRLGYTSIAEILKSAPR